MFLGTQKMSKGVTMRLFQRSKASTASALNKEVTSIPKPFTRSISSFHAYSFGIENRPTQFGDSSVSRKILFNKTTTTTTTTRSIITYSPPLVKVGKKAPAFVTDGVINGEIVDDIDLSSYVGKKYVVLLFYPKDFTYVCPTEIIAFADAHKRFEEVDTQLLAISTDTPESHLAWIKTPRKRGGLGHLNIPLVSDVTKNISNDYGVLLENAGIALRGLFIIDKEGILQQMTVNNLPVGRSVDETIRLIQAFQFNEKYGEVCPANWKPGDKTMKDDPVGSLDYFSTVGENSSSSASGEEGDALEVSPNVKEIHTVAEYKALLKEHSKVIVDYVAPWCGKCRMIMPLVNELADEYTSQGIKFAKIDTTNEALAELLAEEKIDALPQFHFLKDGQRVKDVIIGYKKGPLSRAVNEFSKE